MQIQNPQISNYIDSFYEDQDPLFRELEQLAISRQFPIIGRQTGRLLWQYAALTQAEKVFECGSGFGYSALWFSKGMPKNGKIICTDLSTENLNLAKEIFAKHRPRVKLETHCGNAIEILDKQTDTFDIIFIDVDKFQYDACFDAAWPRLRKGGLLIADNGLWKGSVVNAAPVDESTESVKLFTRRIFKRKDACSSIIPVDDGVLVAVKI
ncbi:MAG: O-methyltransferase [Calditrichaeota bacterium]|nr:MAG: O-methyltransferase [Calditrichota bacterium]